MESARISCTLKFKHPVNAYALVIGGFFPLSLVTNDILLIDRNILGVLSTLSGEGSRHDAEANKWWLGHINRPECRINPVLCAMESSDCSVPTYAQFCASFNDACDQIKKHLPNAQLVRFESAGSEAAYANVLDAKPRYEQEQQFLLAVAPLLEKPVRRADYQTVEQELFRLCAEHELEVYALPFIAALSCLYESRTGDVMQIGRKLIKPSAHYGERQAHNTISDLRALEYLVAANGLGLGSLAFCTRDKALTAFWCALKLREEKRQGANIRVKLTLGEELFPALDPPAFEALYQRMEKQASR